MNRKNSVEDIRKNIMSPLDHMFDDHRTCDSKWCDKNRIEENKKISVDNKVERMKEEYYRCTVKYKELYEKLYKKYDFYTTEEKIIQCKHEFDTKINEEMNICVAKYVPKNKH